jgi:hypothetical protein
MNPGPQFRQDLKKEPSLWILKPNLRARKAEAREVLVELKVLPNLEKADIFNLFEVFSSKRYA